MTQMPLVMVVESESIIRMEAVDLVKDAGYEVIDASDADSALVILHSRNDIGAVFTDIRMPGSLNGMELAHFVRKRWPHIRLMVTSSPQQWDNFPANWRYIQKPYAPEQVTTALRSLNI
jgi:DNA-binding NtrC family response regulator